MYQFRNIDNIENFLLDTLGVDLIVPSRPESENEIVFFQNGDKMTVNTATGEMMWEPLKPGDMFTSKLSLRLHQWFSKGLIIPMSVD